jgi:phosphate transport system substrate-binding protein
MSSKTPSTRLFFGIIFLAAISFTAIKASAESLEQSAELRGAGATFPAPLYKRWISSFKERDAKVKIDYAAVGSGEGVRKFLANELDFAGSDAALSDEQIKQAKNGVQLIPATAGIIVLAYNIEGLGGDLKLPRDVYVDIFSGRISRWNDKRIAAANPGLTLPDKDITIIARLDSSGTTWAFTNHLSAISSQWRDQGPGVGKEVAWVGNTMLARGNEGVASRIKISQNSIGYIEYGFAKRLGLQMAWLGNKSGQVIEPGDISATEALNKNVDKIPDNLRLMIPDPDGEKSYPILTFSWLILHQQYAEANKAIALKQFITYGLTDGQKFSRELGYIALPDSIVSRSLKALENVQKPK